MDPETRRSIWDLVGELRNNTSILLSTHDMEEADVLADRIVMLSSGKVVCAGSPAFLKQACGVGYTINVNTESGDFDLNETLHIVRKTAAHAVVQNEKQGTTTLALQTTDHTGFAEMFKMLEKNSKRLGIASFGVTVATMADVYIKINKLWVPHDGDEEQHGSTRSQVALYLVLLSFAPVAILWPYLLSGVLQTEGSAFTVTLALFVIGGPVTWVLYMLSLVEVSYPRLVRAAFMLLSPPFALAQAAITAVMEGKIGYFCSIHSDKKSRARVSAPVKQNLRLPARGETFLRVGFDKKINYEEEDLCSVSFFSMSEHSVLPDILLLVVEGLVLFVILSLVYSGYGLSLRKIIDAVHGAPPRGSENALDEDVKTERELVERLAKTGASPELERLGYTLVAHDLRKWFGSLQAVKGTSVAIRRGECFGLLGVNGAGKSTTFQMLTGLLHLSAGEAYMSDVKLTSSLRKWQSYIGYCPQDNGLLEKLTAFEHLRLFAGLRGVPDNIVETAVHAAVQFVDVEQYADKPCGTYSMEECERACDRLCIMVAGEMTCLGAMQHLRDKFGTGYTMQLVVARREPTGTQVSAAEATTAEVKSNQALDKDVVALFPEVSVLGAHDNVHDYHVKEKLSWSTVFEKVEQLEESHKFSHVLIQDTNLEQIFISFAEKRAEAHEV